MSFSVDVNNFVKKTDSNTDEFVRSVKIALFGKVIKDTRVDTGRLRGNWQTTTGKPNYSEIDRLDPTPQHEDGGVAQEQVIATVRSDTIDYMTNNLPYAALWEERDGMMAKAMIDVERSIKKALRDVS